MGSTSLTTDSSGVKVSEVRYLPYGEERWTNEVASPADFGFTSQRNERGFGLMDYNARYYSPYLGRFISPDSIVPEPESSSGFNRYRYARNNPLKYTDPSGHCITCDDETSPVMLYDPGQDRSGLVSWVGSPATYDGPLDPRSNWERAQAVVQIWSLPVAVAAGPEAIGFVVLETMLQAEMSQLPPDVQIGVVIPAGGTRRVGKSLSIPGTHAALEKVPRRAASTSTFDPLEAANRNANLPQGKNPTSAINVNEAEVVYSETEVQYLTTDPDMTPKLIEFEEMPNPKKGWRQGVAAIMKAVADLNPFGAK